MNKLISELKRDHMNLVDTLKEAHKIGILNEEGRKKLMSLKTDLLSHMKKEDEELYPPLWREAEKDENFKTALDFFTSNMKDISKKAVSFFDKYSAGGNNMDFVSDYNELLSVLSDRINKEEKILFDEFFKRGL